MLGVQTKDLYKLWGFLLILCSKLNSVLKIQYYSDSQWFYLCTVCVEYLIFNGNQCLMKCGLIQCFKNHMTVYEGSWYCMDPISVVVLVIGLLCISSVKYKCFASRIPVLDCIFEMTIPNGLASTCWERKLFTGLSSPCYQHVSVLLFYVLRSIFWRGIRYIPCCVFSRYVILTRLDYKCNF